MSKQNDVQMGKKDPYINNLFAALIVLTVLGNFIDLCTEGSAVSQSLFLFIFSFHMPLFIFLAGSMSKELVKDHDLSVLCAISMFLFYMGMKIFIWLAKLIMGGKPGFSLFSDSGAPWLFFSLGVYFLLAYLWRNVNKYFLLVLTLVFALLIGYNSSIGDYLIASRTFVFLPFFLLGQMCDIEKINDVTKSRCSRIVSVCILILAFVAMIVFRKQLYVLRPMFTGRNSYIVLEKGAQIKWAYRLTAYAVSVVLSWAVLAVTPRRYMGRLISGIGEKFLSIYFWYRPMLYVLTGLNVFETLEKFLGHRWGRAAWLVIGLICVIVLSSGIGKGLIKLYKWMNEKISAKWLPATYGTRKKIYDFIKKNLVFRVVCFMSIGLILFSFVSKILVSPASDYRNYQWIAGFYEEPENSLDAVFIGSSAVYSSWIAPWAWNQYGITVYPFACNSQPMAAAKYMIKEARKRQPNAVYIISVSVFGADFTEPQLHYLTDYMPVSFNKIQMTNALLDMADYDWKDRLEFYIPVIRYHSRWNELKKDDFQYKFDGLKGASTYNVYLKNQNDVSESERHTSRRGNIDEKFEKALKETLQYCKEEDVKAVFVTSTGLVTDESILAQRNSIFDLIESYGFPVLDTLGCMDEIGIDPVRDYYNASHVNIHGSIKTTDYLSRYLIEHFGLTDKRGDTDYISWDEAYEKYLKYANPNVLDIEWNMYPRDNSIDAPVLSEVSVDGTWLTVSWEEVSGADGYSLYRKTAGKNWELLVQVDSEVTKYVDKDCTVGKQYTYTVVAYQGEENYRKWGPFDIKGISGTAALPAPTLLELTGVKDNLTLTWEKVKDADGYLVLRRLPGKNWIQIADLTDEYSYTDTDMLDEMPYQYTVRPYYLDSKEARILGSYDTIGLLWVPEDLNRTADVRIEQGSITVTWDRIEGISGYRVSRKTRNSEWAPLTDYLSPDTVEYRDITAKADEEYSYQITPFISCNEDYDLPMDMTTEWVRAENSKYLDEYPSITFLEQAGDYICLSWETASGATSYRVWRRPAMDDAEWEIAVNSVVDTTYLDKPKESGEYEYLVQALYSDGEITYYGEISYEMDDTVWYESMNCAE